MSLLDGGRRRWRAGWEAVVNMMVLVRCSRHYSSTELIELIVAIKCRIYIMAFQELGMQLPVS